jgi:hypothetical protein
LKPTASTIDGLIKTNAALQDVTGAGGESNDNITVPTAQLNKNLCVEFWKFSDTAVACVKVSGQL